MPEPSSTKSFLSILGSAPGNFFKSSRAEISGQNRINATVDRFSNMGRSNPLGPSARTLFYQGGKNSLDGESKYGQYLFYGIMGYSDRDNEFVDAYYYSENRKYNRKISSLRSKNPTAKALVTSTVESERGTNDSDSAGYIVGKSRAPYSWSDFLYCKYYGRIPNNYMVTLRRYPTPMRDNLSIPTVVEETDLHKLDGVGKPVAQAITWFGGKTGNTLDNIIGFTTGLNWQPRTQEEILRQSGMNRGFQESLLARLISGTESSLTEGQGSPFSDAIITVASLINGSTQEGEQNITDAYINYNFRELASNPGGPLSDYIFTSVDVVDKMQIRETGIKFEAGELALNFHYELTSLGEVNTKAAFLDLLANLLSLGTNYGTFMTPDFRYDNEFPAIGFPGGSEGLKTFYTSPLRFISEFINSGSLSAEAETSAQSAASALGINDPNQMAKEGDLLKYLVGKAQEIYGSGDQAKMDAADRALKYLFREDFVQNFQMNQSFFTGAPTGEWHLVVGNPFNPIAMIGNLICSSLKISFGSKLGPDDFPTEIQATYTLEHARSREKAEIESMFNRGEGRLYQSTIKTSANSQSSGVIATPAGIVNNGNPEEINLYNQNAQ